MKKIIYALIIGSILFTTFSFAQCVAGATSCNDVLIPQINQNNQVQQDIFDSVLRQVGSFVDQTLSKKSSNVENNKVADKIDALSKKLTDLSIKLRNVNSITQTQNSNCQRISQTLWQGNPNQNAKDVILLQQFLQFNTSAYEKGMIVDGIYGNETSSHVKDFQKRNGIVETGVVGPRTLAKINSMICNRSNNSQYCSQKYANVACPAIALNCASGYYMIPSTPKYDSDGCRTNLCDQGQCVPNAVPISCPMPSCMKLECPAGQHSVGDTPSYGANGCQTNMCAQKCIPDQGSVSSCVAYDFKLNTSDNLYHSMPTYYSEGQNYTGSCAPNTVQSQNVFPVMPPSSCPSNTTYFCRNGQWSATQKIY
jgi:hypothetical protein